MSAICFTYEPKEIKFTWVINGGRMHVLSIDLEVLTDVPPFQAPQYLGDVECTAINAWRDPLPIDLEPYSHVILSGSTCSIMDDDSIIKPLTALIACAIGRGIPILGICYGHQLLARVLLGKQHVRRSNTPEIGWLPVKLTEKGKQEFAGLPDNFHVFVGHFDEVCNLPPDWEITAHTDKCTAHGFINDRLKIMGFQFHPEMNAEIGNICFSKSENAAIALGTTVAEILANTRDEHSRDILFPAFLNRW